MPTTLTDSNTYTSSVTVPADADAANAASVSGAFQALANRTKFLKEIVSPTSPPSKPKRASIHLAKNFGSWTMAQGGPWSVSAPASDILEIPLSDIIPTGCTLTAVAVLVNPGTARSTTNRIGISLYKVTAAASQTQIGSTTYDNAGTGSQTITLGSLSESIDLSSYEYFVRLKAGASGATDTFYNLTVTFNDAGPRSY